MTKVAVLKTSPQTVLQDIADVMRMAEYERTLPKNAKTVLKLNLSWSLFFPACSTSPWQLEGVLKTLRSDGYKNLTAVEDQTVVTHTWKGAYKNKWLPILNDNAVEFNPLPNIKWIEYEPKGELLAFHKIFEKILIPEIYFGSSIIHLPTMKTHGHTVITGAVKNAFGGMIPKYRHHSHKYIHDILVDLIILQKEIFSGMFHIVDGTVAGDGAGPRTMIPRQTNLLLASADSVAVDALSAKIIGFDPMMIPFLKKAHNMGLGIADTDQIEIIGEKPPEYKFKTKRSPIIFFDQLLRKGTMGIGPIHKLLFNSPIFKFFIFCSSFYHDSLWYPTIGRHRINDFLKTEWGALWKKYPYGSYPENISLKKWDVY